MPVRFHRERLRMNTSPIGGFLQREMAALSEMSTILDNMDEAARIRCLNYLRAKFVPNGNLPESTGVTWFQPTQLPTVGGGKLSWTLKTEAWNTVGGCPGMAFC